MGQIENFEQLEVWQQAHRLVLAIHSDPATISMTTSPISTKAFFTAETQRTQSFLCSPSPYLPCSPALGGRRDFQGSV